MKLNKQSLVAARFAYPSGERPTLNRVLVESDGTTVGIDGHALCVVTPPGGECDNVAADDVYLSVGAAKEMADDLRSKGPEHAYEWTGDAFEMRHKNGRRIVEPPDEVQDEAAGKYPKWRTVVPDDSEDDYEIALDIAKIEQALKALKSFHRGSDVSPRAVNLRIKHDQLDPVKLTAKNPETDQAITIVLMPLRI